MSEKLEPWSYEGNPQNGFVYLIAPNGKRAASLYGTGQEKIDRAVMICDALNTRPAQSEAPEALRRVVEDPKKTAALLRLMQTFDGENFNTDGNEKDLETLQSPPLIYVDWDEIENERLKKEIVELEKKKDIK